MKLSHLIFADDLLLFSKGDAASMMTLLRSFSTFSKTTGLNMSKGKSNAYFNGVQAGLKQEILQISGMVEGSLPFRNLGVPIKTTRLSVLDCKPLIDKVVAKIRGLGARKLSYAGRLVLCLGKKACKPTSEGGLGLKNEVVWNRAAIRKLVWRIATKSDHLWVRWVNHIYIKGQNWETYNPPTNSSWYWKRICRVKTLLSEAYEQDLWVHQHHKVYTIAKGYDFLRDKGQEVSWQGLVWNKWSVPKHSFFAWVYHHNNLNTMEKLYRVNISEEDTCLICRKGTESRDHLFFSCPYSRRVVTKVGEWLGIQIPSYDLISWILVATGSKLRKGVVNAVINACLYHLWQQRNQSRIDLTLNHPCTVASRIIEEMQNRVMAIIKQPIKEKDRSFVSRIERRGRSS
ncbi:uncharacterized protein LOC141630590 [Silene latifolia]|uniref:uncharacterized protein LOC141630590 n=1 Tax=Silene latifolia TaxID=37657 RepID=UPI003D77FC7F